MILRRGDALPNNKKTLRATAVALLDRWMRRAGLPLPHYRYEIGGHAKKPSHFYKVTVRIPQAFKRRAEEVDGLVVFENAVTGSGRDGTKKYAKSLAALEAVHRLQLLLGVDDLQHHADAVLGVGGAVSRREQEREQEEEGQSDANNNFAPTTNASSADGGETTSSVSVSSSLVRPSWNSIPLDAQFSETLPASRRGAIDFGLLLLPTRSADPQLQPQHSSEDVLEQQQQQQEALAAAKALTLTARGHLPRTAVHGHPVDGGLIPYVFVHTHPNSAIAGYTQSPRRGHAPNRSYPQALQWTLQQIYRSLQQQQQQQQNSAPKKNKNRKKGKNNKSNHRRGGGGRDCSRDDADDDPSERLAMIRQRVLQDCSRHPSSSWGMAKLFVKLTGRQFQELRRLLNGMEHKDEEEEERRRRSSTIVANSKVPNDPTQPFNNAAAAPAAPWNTTSASGPLNPPPRNVKKKIVFVHHRHGDDSDERLQARRRAFAKHQQAHPLPVDGVELPFLMNDNNNNDNNNDDNESRRIAIVRGGTGSGKTTRIPLRLCLYAPLQQQQQQQRVRVVVVQPRRLACLTVAQRVAHEQGYDLKNNENYGDCPVGYAIRFEARPASDRHSRTMDFCTPMVLLRAALRDDENDSDDGAGGLLFSNITHLVIDEVHERGADADLLLALARRAVRKRAHTANPLRLVLMSATMPLGGGGDDDPWHDYFGNNMGDCGKVTLVDVPDVRRFPIETIHVGDRNFPKGLSSTRALPMLEKKADHENNSSGSSSDYHEQLCEATAELAWRVFQDDCGMQDQNIFSSSGGSSSSILCFLPGMDEIRRVERQIRQLSRNMDWPVIHVLHSSISSSQQARAFETGPKIILSTNIAETSVTLPDVKVVIDSGRERQFSMLESSGDESVIGNTVVGSQLTTVNISQASARQREGRTGRVSAGVCYRLYTRKRFEHRFEAFTKPEMLRLDLQQLVMHALSLYHRSEEGHPLNLLLEAPDPPPESKLRQTLRGLSNLGLVDFGKTNYNKGEVDRHGESYAYSRIELTPLGRAVGLIPTSPRMGRLLFVGLALCAVDPALSMAALLSVPAAFQPSSHMNSDSRGLEGCSDIVVQLEAYHAFLREGNKERSKHPQKTAFEQVSRVREQLKVALTNVLLNTKKPREDQTSNDTWELWNTNSHRVGAIAALINNATPFIAHLVGGMSNFATRDIAGYAKIHPSSTNFNTGKRTHWYLYNELRATKAAYLHATTAVSPLELALFAGPSVDENDDPSCPYGLFLADQWVPVDVSASSQRDALIKLRRILVVDILQQLAVDHRRALLDSGYNQIVLFVLSVIEQQRLPM